MGERDGGGGGFFQKSFGAPRGMVGTANVRMSGRDYGNSFPPFDASRAERMHGRHEGIAHRLWGAANSSAGAGGVSLKTRSAVSRAFSAHCGADVAKQPGCGKLPGMLGRARVSGGAALGESDDGGHDG